MALNVGDKIKIVPHSNEVWEIVEINSYNGIYQPNVITLKKEDIVIGVSTQSVIEIIKEE